MKKRNKIILVACIAVATVALICFLAVYFVFLHRYHGKEIEAPWQAEDPFSLSNIATLEKQPGQPFVILNLADVQLCDLEDLFHMGETRQKIAGLIEKTHPDLITLTGDQTWSNENLISLLSLVSWLDSFQIPYAPVFGNHDFGNDKNSAVLDCAACCDVYEKGKFSLFKRGPSNLGSLGNYVVNVTEEGKIVKTLYFLDSGYEDCITDAQIAWVQWNANGIRAANGGAYAEAACFFHLPLPEYAEAYRQYRTGEGNVEAVGEVYVTYSLAGSSQNGFFAAAKSVGVSDMVCGHQHGNLFTLQYDGVRLTFALKTGKLGGYYAGEDVTLDGATCLILDGGKTTVFPVFSDP